MRSRCSRAGLDRRFDFCFASISMKPKVTRMKSDSLGQLILTGVPGTELDSETAALFRRVQPGGFILFGRNIQSARQLRKLIDDLRDLSEIEPIITIDQEGGRVSRLRLIGNEPPNAQQLRDRNDVALVRRHGEITGQLLRLFGFNLDLCPVLDISFDDEADNSLRGRCYGKTRRTGRQARGRVQRRLARAGDPELRQTLSRLLGRDGRRASRSAEDRTDARRVG